MIETKEILMRAMVAIEEMAILFYQQKTQDGYNKLQDALAYITEAIDCLFAIKNETGYNTNEMLASLNAAMISLEKKDTILLSDILQYELKEELKKAVMTLQ